MARHPALLLALITSIMAAGCGSKASPAPSAQGQKSPVKHTANKAGSALSSSKKMVQKAGTGPGLVHALKPYSAPPSKLPTGSIAAGSKVYSASCAVCHGSGGTGTSSGLRLAMPSGVVSHFMTEPALEVFIAHNMPANNPGILSTTDAVNVAAYIWHIAGGK